MITNQPVNNHDDMRKVTDNVLRDAGLRTIRNTGVFFGACAGDEIFPFIADNLIGILEGVQEAIRSNGFMTEGSYAAALGKLRTWKDHPAAAQWYVVNCAEGIVPD